MTNAQIEADLRSYPIAGPELADKAADRIAMLDALVRDFTSEDECYFDHHGYCQAHMWFYIHPKCPHARAKELL